MQRIAAALVILALCTTPGARANLITVDTFADEFDSNTSADLGCSLREAIFAANEDTAYGSCGSGGGNSDLIFLPAGTYSLVLNSTPIPGNGGDLEIGEKLSIIGTGGTPVIDASSLGDRIFTVLPGAEIFALTNVELTGGSVTGDGGAIHLNTQSTLVLTNVTIRDSHATGRGGGVTVTNSAPYADPLFDFTGVTFRDNTAGGQAGALALGTTNVTSSTCDDCLFVDNQALDGGAVQILSSARITFTDTEFLSNDATDGEGGAIYSAQFAWVTLNDVLLENNTDTTAVSDADGYVGYGTSVLFIDGGTFRNSIRLYESSDLSATGARFEQNVGPAILSKGARAELTGVVVADNEQTQGGTFAIQAQDNELTITDSLFERNEGALRCWDCELLVVGSSFVDNEVETGTPRGAAVHVRGLTADAEFENVTWSGNELRLSPTLLVHGAAAFLEEGAAFRFNNVTMTGNRGGALKAVDVAVAPEISNSLLAGNVVGPVASPFPSDCVGSVQTLGWNLVGADGGCVPSPTAGDQIGSLGSPIDAGIAGRTLVGGLPVHGLLLGSPALDAGNPAAVGGSGSACEPQDQVGQGRPFDAGGGAVCDIGAIEETDPALSDVVFEDGFESGGTQAWSSTP